jgi:hypothetical protein
VGSFVRCKINIALQRKTPYLHPINRNAKGSPMQFTENFEKSQAQVQAISAQAMTFAEENTKAGFAFVREAMSVKSPDAFWSMQQSFFRAQQEAATRQAETLGKLVTSFWTPAQKAA